MHTNENPVLTITDHGLAIAVWFDRYDTVDPPRSQYGYRIVGKDHREGDPVYAEGTDLRCAGDPDLAEALRALLSFWSAAAESFDRGCAGENADLFPDALLELVLGSDDITYTATWLGGER